MEYPGKNQRGNIMNKLIQSDLSKCVGCNLCVHVCPINEANITLIENGQLMVGVDNEKCIVCGACLAVCRQKSRDYDDDTERFIEDLMNGVAISVFCTPPVSADLPDWDRILTWLRRLGAKNIFDISFGADISAWAYIRWIRQNSPKTIIFQPCPAIVDYVLLHNPSLLPYLSPVHSPMMCAAIYIRRYQNTPHRFAAISPCIAKSSEFKETGNLVSYNVTFKKLEEYIARNDIPLPVEPGNYDHQQSGLGAVYSYTGGLKENVEFFLGQALRADKSEGQSLVYKVLDEFGKGDMENWPMVLDLINCPEGCRLGTGAVNGKTVSGVETAMENAGKAELSGMKRKYLEQMFADFDGSLRLTDFVRQYSPRPVAKKEAP